MECPGHAQNKIPNTSSVVTFFYCGASNRAMYDRVPMRTFWLLSFLLSCGSAAAQLHEYKATDVPRAGENIAQPCDYQATFPAGDRPVKAAWVTYDRGPDITRFYSDPDVLVFAKRNDVAMVLAIQCPASKPPTGEIGEGVMNPEQGLGPSLFSALN